MCDYPWHDRLLCHALPSKGDCKVASVRVCLGKKHVFDLIGIFTGGGEVDVGVYVVLLPNLRGRSWFLPTLH